MITVRRLNKHFGPFWDKRVVFEALDATFEDNQTYVIFGARSSGKTTLLRLLCGLQTPTTGHVKRKGAVVIPPGGYRQIDPNKTGHEMADLLSHLYGAHAKQVVSFVSQFAELEDELLRKPLSSLTADQRSKYGFALSYALPGGFYLFDDAIAYGSSKFSQQCLDAFKTRQAEAGVIIVSREVRTWAQLGGRGAILHGGLLYFFESVDEAAEHYRELELENSEVGLPLAKALLKAGHTRRAEQHLDEFLSERSSEADVETFILLASLRMRAGRLPEAREAAMAALERNSSSPDPWYLLARLSQLEGRLEAAVAEALRVLQVAPAHREARLLLARCYDALGMSEESADIWRGLAEASGNRSFLHLALSRYEKGSYWERILDAVAGVDATDLDVRVLELKARALLALGRWREASEALRDLGRADMAKVGAELYRLTRTDRWEEIVPLLNELSDLDWPRQAHSRNVLLTISFLEQRLAKGGEGMGALERADLEQAIDTFRAACGLAIEERDTQEKPDHAARARTALSVGKPSFASSTLGEHDARFGNDGAVLQRGKFFHTRKEAGPWWSVDLGEVTEIGGVLLFDRLEHRERADTLVVEVSRDDTEYEIIYERAQSPDPVEEVTLVSWRGSARYVRVRLQDTNYLHMRQVAVLAPVD